MKRYSIPNNYQGPIPLSGIITRTRDKTYTSTYSCAHINVNIWFCEKRKLKFWK